VIARHPEGDMHEIARGLVASVRSVLVAGRGPDAATREVAWRSAVDVAELLELPGLAALLTACAPHATAPPVPVLHVLERLARLASETETRGDLEAFVTADRELGALAGTLGAQAWGEPNEAGEPRVPVQPLAELLGELTVEGREAIEHADVSLPVAAALSAALDWLGADAGGALRVRVQDAAMTLSLRATHEPGLGPAGAVLSLSGGALLPEPDGRWALRVPLHVDRPAFLLVRQGELLLALPWHAVARLCIADDAARAAMTEPSLAPWSPLERGHGERPAALLALGLTRAWLHVDHIVWRVFARPEPAEVMDLVPGGRHVVRTESEAEYWVVDVTEALAGVPGLAPPPPRPRPRPEAAPDEPAVTSPAPPAPPAPAPQEGASLEGAPEPAPALAESPRVEPPGSDEDEEPLEWVTGPPPLAPALRVLGPADVRPLGRPSTGEDAPPAPPEPPAPEHVARRALIADDSLVARLALGRVLEREGWVVEWVEDAAAMWEALAAEEWTAVFADVSLPDAASGAHLPALASLRLESDRPFELIALTRDDDEERTVRASGIGRVLRKPFASEALEALVAALPAAGARP